MPHRRQWGLLTLLLLLLTGILSAAPAQILNEPFNNGQNWAVTAPGFNVTFNGRLNVINNVHTNTGPIIARNLSSTLVNQLQQNGYRRIRSRFRYQNYSG